MALAYELYGDALRRPTLRTASTAWDAMLTEVFESRVDTTTARALVEPVLRRLLGRSAGT